jgi:hypothetical protein
MLSDFACPDCRRGPITNSIAKARPSLIPLWNAKKNGDLSPTTVDAAQVGNTWWRCPKAHEFQRSPLLMIRDSSCPVCAVAEKSLATINPVVAAEWHPKRNGEITPTQIGADHVMNAWWLCPNGHDYQATVRSRARGSRNCPTCYGGWSLDNIRAFVKSLLTHVAAFNPSEMFALAMQAGVFADKDSRPFVMAISTGRFPREELEKFAEGKPSLVDEFAANKALTLEIVDGRPKQTAAASADPFTLPAAPEPFVEGERVDVDVSRDVDATGSAAAAVAATDDEMPLVKTQDALAALESALVANADAETVKFLLDSAKAKLWRHAYLNPKEAREQAASFKGDVYSTLVRDRFLAEFDEADALQIPAGYAFRLDPNAPVIQPNLMQRRVAVSVRNERRYGNWSGMGAGKTLSAIVATRVVGAALTVICCPNAVVENWTDEIMGAFPASEVATKTWHPEWKDPLETAPRYLVLNYEHRGSAPRGAPKCRIPRRARVATNTEVPETRPGSRRREPSTLSPEPTGRGEIFDFDRQSVVGRRTRRATVHHVGRRPSGTKRHQFGFRHGVHAVVPVLGAGPARCFDVARGIVATRLCSRRLRRVPRPNDSTSRPLRRARSSSSRARQRSVNSPKGRSRNSIWQRGAVLPRGTGTRRSSVKASSKPSARNASTSFARLISVRTERSSSVVGCKVGRI